MRPVQLTAEQKVEFGKAVAELKTYLHEVETCVSDDKCETVCCDTLSEKLHKVLCFCDHDHCGESGDVTNRPPKLDKHKLAADAPGHDKSTGRTR
jgi:hypothetical protein